jgi:hypothetical protein
MHNSGPNSHVGNGNGTPALPLFRAEAMAARQNNQGDILLIRPFSLLFLSWLGVGITLALLCFLIFGRYAPRTRVMATITSAKQSAFSVSLQDFAGESSQIAPGRQLFVRCTGCSSFVPADVTSVSAASSVTNCSGPDCSQLQKPQSPASSISVSLVLEGTAPARLAVGSRLEIEVSHPSRRLIRWLLDKPEF